MRLGRKQVPGRFSAYGRLRFLSAQGFLVRCFLRRESAVGGGRAERRCWIDLVEWRG